MLKRKDYLPWDSITVSCHLILTHQKDSVDRVQGQEERLSPLVRDVEDIGTAHGVTIAETKDVESCLSGVSFSDAEETEIVQDTVGASDGLGDVFQNGHGIEPRRSKDKDLKTETSTGNQGRLPLPLLPNLGLLLI